jgi:hypothetical protein
LIVAIEDMFALGSVADPGSEFFHPGSEFFHPGSRLQGQKDYGYWIRIKEFQYF